MRKRKILKIFLIVFVLSVGLVLGALEMGSRIYQENARAYFREQFSQKSDMVLEPFQTNISVWRHFPQITFTFRNLSFLDTTGQVPFRVLYIRQAEVAVPLTQFRLTRLRIRRVTLQEVLFHQKVDSTGKKTGLDFSKSLNPDTTGDRMPFTLPRLQLRQVRIISENHFKKSAFALFIREGQLAITSKNQQLHIGGELAGKIEHLTSNKLRLFRGQPFNAHLDYDYLFNQKKGVFRHTYALVHNNRISILGTHQARNQGPGARLNLTLRGSQPLLSLFREALPPQVQPFLRRLQTTSRMQLVYRITGDSGPMLRPRNQLTFSLKNGTFYLPASRKYIRQVNLRGTLDNGARHAPQTSRFRIDHMSAGVSPDQFTLSLEVANFLAPSFSVQGKGRMDLPAAAAFVKLPFDSVTRGYVSGAFALRGNLPDTLGNRRAHWRGDGHFQVREAAFKPMGLAAQCRGVNATLQYTDSLLQLRDLSGTIGGHPFIMQASVSNYTAYLFNEPGLIVSQASIYAKKLDMKWLRSSAAAPRAKAAPAPQDQPARAPARLDPWRNMQTQVNLVVDQLQVPGQEQIRKLTVKISQRGDRVNLSRMRFTTTKGGIATARGGFRLIPAGISMPSLDVNVKYTFLNLQTFMQNLANFKSGPNPGKVADKDKKDMEDYLDKRYWLNLHVQAHSLQYLYLQGANLVLTANVNRQRAALSRLHLQAFGGQLDARGEIKLNAPGNGYPLQLKARVQNIDLQQLFRVAENMKLDLLSSRNIRGTADCRLTLISRLDETFSPGFDRTVAYVRSNFRNMELIDVAPIQQALRFLRKERTSHLYFQDVQSTFVLEENTFLTPGFDLNSNLTDFSLSGTYTMGGAANLNMDVNVLSVLFGNNKRRIEKIQADSTVSNTDSLANPKTDRRQHLLVTGEQNKYKVKLSNRKTREQNARALKATYSQLIRHHSIDTVFQMK